MYKQALATSRAKFALAWMGLVLATVLVGTPVWASLQEAPGAPSPGGAPGGPRFEAPETEVVPIPPYWRSGYPFSLRFEASAGQPGRHVIDLKAASFATEPLRGRDERGALLFKAPDTSSFPAQLVGLPFSATGRDYFIVQAASPEDQVSLRAWLEEEGIPILEFIPQNAYLLRLDAESKDRVSKRPEVFWVGFFQPAFRIHPKLDYVVEVAPDHELTLEATFDSALYPDAGAVMAAPGLASLDLRDLTPTAVGWRARFVAQAVQCRDLALVPGCLWVERYVEPQLYNNVARTSANTATGRGPQAGPLMDVEDVWARGIRGEGQIASAADTGLSTGSLSSLHRDFGQQGAGDNPLRVLKGYALGRSGWDDDMSIGGGHGTHTSGSIVGNGIRSGATPSSNNFPTSCFAGTAPKAQFVFQSVMDSQGGLGGIPSDLTTLFQPPYTDGARVHSNSWGAAVSGDYTTRSQDLDRFTWANPDMVITFSAGNSGIDGKYASGGYCYSSGDAVDGVIDDDSIGAPGTAKNCITVGAAENYRPDFVYEYPQNDCSGDGFTQQAWGWFNGCSYSVSPLYADLMANNAAGLAAFSSRGPTNDGRFKPDVVAPGVGIISTRSDQNQTYEQWGTCNVPASYKAYYMTQGGTSMSNPLTAGTAVLVRQYYQDGWHPNHSQTTNGSASSSQGFSPSSALVKATLINGAWDMAPGQFGTGTTQEIPPGWDSGHDLPNNAEGYGRVDLEHALFPGSGWGDAAQRRLEVHDATPGLQTGQLKDYPITVASSANPLIVTLVWTDPYGATSAGTELVNDLDLTVTSPGGTVYYPNGLNRTSGADHKNNVEQVKVTSPAAGAWTVRVNGTSIPGNAVDGTTTQPYALVISGVLTPPCSTPPGVPTGLGATAPVAGQIALSWSAGSPAGTSYHVYRTSGTCPGTGFTQIASAVTLTHYTDTAVSAGRTYAYVVTAQLEGCESEPSNCASAKALGSCATPPSFAGLASVANVAGGSCALALSWSPATPLCDGPVTYAIYRSTAPSFAPSPANRVARGVSGTSYIDACRLGAGTPYYYIVRAVDESNLAEEGNTLIKTGTTSGGGGPTTLFSADFETGSGLAGWSTGYFSPATDAADWRGIMACSAHGGSKIFRFGGSDCSQHYADYANSIAVPGGTAGLTIPSGATSSRLSFWHRWSFEDHWDGAFMRISLNDYNYYYLSGSASGVWISGGYNSYANYPSGTRDAWSGTSSAFTYTEMDLDAAVNTIPGESGGAAGKTIFIGFGGYADYSNTDDGWYLDDVTVTYGGSSGPCTTCPSVAVTSVNAICPGVQVTLAVTDAAGSPVPGLGGSAFALTEDGSSQTFSATDLGSGNYQLAYTTTRLDGQLHALDLALTYGGCTVHTQSSARCAALCSLTCTATVPTTGQPGQPVAFSATATATNCSGSPSYLWAFGDGSTSTSQNPSHTYASSGSFNWSLTVNADGATCSKNGSITLANPPQITLMKKVAPPFSIVVTGSNLQPGIKVFIDGTEWTAVLYKTSAKIKLTGGASLKAVVPKGVQKTFLFRNPDGGQATMAWSY